MIEEEGRFLEASATALHGVCFVGAGLGGAGDKFIAGQIVCPGRASVS